MTEPEKNWKGLKSIVMEKKKIEKAGKTTYEYRYFISSLKTDINEASRAVRGHWSIESMHWHLDVTFREDANTTIDKIAAQNLNIIRKWSLSILKPVELARHKLSMRNKRFVVSLRQSSIWKNFWKLKKQKKTELAVNNHSCVCRGGQHLQIDFKRGLAYNLVWHNCTIFGVYKGKNYGILIT